MPYIPADVVSRAKQMDLYTYLRSYEPQPRRRLGIPIKRKSFSFTILPASRYEATDDADRGVAASTDTSSDLEAVETGKNPTQNAAKTVSRGIARPQIGKLLERAMESGNDAQLGHDKRETDQGGIPVPPRSVPESL